MACPNSSPKDSFPSNQVIRAGWRGLGQAGFTVPLQKNGTPTEANPVYIWQELKIFQSLSKTYQGTALKIDVAAVNTVVDYKQFFFASAD